MIKLIAALTMLIDHIGVIFFPSAITFRLIGRLSMPLYAYCVARGFDRSSQHGTLRTYMINMAVLAFMSQIPFHFISSGNLNICFTWMLSLLLLKVINSTYGSPLERAANIAVTFGVVLLLVGFDILPVDYGISGVLLPLLFHALMKRNRETAMDYVLVLLAAWAVYVLVQGGIMLQIVSVASAFILVFYKKRDDTVRLPKWAFYAFYPAHLAVLLMLRYLIV